MHAIAGKIIDESAGLAHWSAGNSDDKRGGATFRNPHRKVRGDRLSGVGDRFTGCSDDKIKNPILKIVILKSFIIALLFASVREFRNDI